MKLYFLFFVVLLFVGSGCYDNIDNTPEEPEVIIQTSEVYVTTQLSGNVEDADEQTITDYSLHLNGTFHDIPSDYFLIEVDEARKKGQTIRVQKDGNQIGLRTELLVENDINHMTITTHDIYKSDSKSKSEAIVQIRKELSANFVDARFKSDYTGDLQLEYVDIDPKIKLTPVGYDYESHLLAVDSKGGFYLKAYDNQGNELEVDRATPVLLTIGELDEDVNALFQLNEKTDIWELLSEISDNSEVEIAASGYYTFAKFTKGVFVEGVITKDERVVAYQPMRWSHTGLDNPICATEKGRWIGLLPEKDLVEIEILNPCDESLQSEKIEINNEDLQNQNVSITNTDSYQYLNSTVIDCNGEAISNAAINITSNNADNHYVFSEDGQNRWIAVCGDFTIAAYDESTDELGTGIEWSTSLNEAIGLLNGCSEYADGFSYFKIRDDEGIFPAFNLETINDRTVLSSQDGEIKIIFSGNQVGSYEEREVNIVIDEAKIGNNQYYILCENSMDGCGIKDFKVTHYDLLPNGQIRAEFSGALWMQTVNTNLAGTYPVQGLIVSKTQ